MAVHYITDTTEKMFGESFDRRSLGDRLELGFGIDCTDEGMDGWMDGWMDNWLEGMVCMFCIKVIENKKLSDNLGENSSLKGGVRSIYLIDTKKYT